MVLECQASAEDNLSDIDQKIYEMYPHISNYELETTIDQAMQAEFEVLADFDIPVVSNVSGVLTNPKSGTSRKSIEEINHAQVAETGGRSTVTGNDSCEVSYTQGWVALIGALLVFVW